MLAEGKNSSSSVLSYAPLQDMSSIGRIYRVYAIFALRTVDFSHASDIMMLSFDKKTIANGGICMKKVLLIGDSIRLGYQEYVKTALDGECEVIFPEDNSRFAANAMWQTNQMLRYNPDISLVHFNAGYWDMNIEAPMTEPIHPVEEYVGFLRRIVKLCRACGAKVIFATTVPILDSDNAPNSSLSALPGERYGNEWVKTYNAAATALMSELNVPINDLYELCMQDANRYKCEDLLHLTEDGYRRCAEQVSEHIRRFL